MEAKRIKELENSYRASIQEYCQLDKSNQDIVKLLMRKDGTTPKFWNCVNITNAERNILWTSINPSLGDEKKGIPTFNMSWEDIKKGIRTPKDEKLYWGELMNKISDVVDICGHMDILPIHITNEDEVKSRFFTSTDSQERKFISKLVIATQNFIEELRPKLIIHSNVGSSFLWGLNKDKGWMGYTLQPISLEAKISSGRIVNNKTQNSLFKITGVSENSFIKTTDLIGCYLLIDYQVARPEFREKSLKHDDVLKIWNELKEK
ncbi:MAG: hypothetical protein MJY84_02675 [Bacteroidales bacterium]|nr:hypothetical protein [Bacteroidales bacterium]